MKPQAWCVSLGILVLGLVCVAPPHVLGAGMPESDGAWSKPVDGMCGRLVAISGLSGKGATEISVFVELQNSDASPPVERTLVFNPDTSLSWALTDGHGKPVPPWTGQSLYSGWSLATVGKAGQRFPGAQISVAGDLVSRFRVCTGAYYLLDGPMALLFSQGLIGTPPWHLAADGHGPYLLSATFKGLDEGGASPLRTWSGLLDLPPVCLPTDTILVAWQQKGIKSQKIGPQSATLLGSIEAPDSPNVTRVQGAGADR